MTESTPTKPTTSYLTNDTLGSPRVITDASGNVQSRRDFMPFGEEISAIGGRTSGLGYQSDDVRQKFTVYERDDETDLDFAQARMYANKLGRFITTDPVFTTLERLIDPQRLNSYGYSRNTPTKFLDPTGKDIELNEKDKESAEAKLQLLTKGLKKDDRQYVKLIVGDGNDGYAKGKFYVVVDKDAKSESKNFQALQNIANDREKLTVVSFVKSGSYSNMKGTEENGKIVLKESKDPIGFYKATDLADDTGSTIEGVTLFGQSDSTIRDVQYSKGKNNEVLVWSEQSDVEVVATFFHELRGHVYLSNNGREPIKGIHGTKGVSTEARNAEKEARGNFEQE